MAIYLALLIPEAQPRTILVRWGRQFATSKAFLPSSRMFVGQPADKFPETKVPR